MTTIPETKTDIILIGAGIMSATLGILLKELNPSLTISIYERMDNIALESSDAWNNAGTGHSAFCELNYTPQLPNGTIDISKAIKIATSFEQSKQFWSYLISHKHIPNHPCFINHTPHLSFVWGNENCTYLKKRHEALSKHPLFNGMEFTEDKKILNEWIPVMMHNRDNAQEVAATKMDIGTDVNFGVLTRSMFSYLQSLVGVNVFLNHEVEDIERQKNNQWQIKVKNLTTADKQKVNASFVFIGAGGGSLHLLEKSDIKEAEGFGGFPISGQFLKCLNPTIIAQHNAKVYGKASVGSPPMSVPHLDTRMINEKKELLFGPYAGFSTKFLKNGSYLDLLESIELENIIPMLSAGWHNLPLTKYLIDQVRQSHEDRVAVLKEYLPDAQENEWELITAGQRVQVIKKDEKEGGILEFGTEVVACKDGSLVALLGASPGASTAVSIMLEVIKNNISVDIKTPNYEDKLKQMIPTYEQDVEQHAESWLNARKQAHLVLGL